MKVISLVGPSVPVIGVRTLPAEKAVHLYPLTLTRELGAVLADSQGVELARFHHRTNGEDSSPVATWSEDPDVGMFIVSCDLWVARTLHVGISVLDTCQEVRERWGADSLRHHIQSILEQGPEHLHSLLRARVCPVEGIQLDRKSPTYKAGINSLWVRALLPH